MDSRSDLSSLPAATSYLDPLSSLAARSFNSTAELIQAVLSLIVGQVPLRTSFLTEITPADNRNRVIAAYNRPGGIGISAGADLVLEDTF